MPRSRQVARLFRSLDRETRARASTAVDAAANIVADEIRARVPDATGAMKAAVEVTHSEGPKSVSASAGLPLHGGHPDRDSDVVLHVEFGTIEADPKPFFRPAVAAKRSEAEAAVRRDVLG